MKLFVVLGLGQFGRSLATTLHAGGGDVLAIDRDERRVDDVKDSVGQAVCMDGTDIHALRAVQAPKAQTAVVALGEEDLEGSILACVALSELGVGNIIVRAANELQGRILSRVGATKVIYPEKQMGEHVARNVLNAGVEDQFILSTGQTVAEIRPRHDVVGKRLKDLDLRARYRVNVVSIKRMRARVDDRGEAIREPFLVEFPGGDDIVEHDDVLIAVGNQAQIERLARKD